MSFGPATATEYSRFAAAPTFGLGTTLQAPPSQCSISVWATKVNAVEPTAQTLRSSTTATAWRLLAAPFGLGLSTRRQASPHGGGSTVGVGVPGVGVKVGVALQSGTTSRPAPSGAAKQREGVRVGVGGVAVLVAEGPVG